MDIDAILEQLPKAPNERIAMLLLDKLMEVLIEEPNVLCLSSPINVCGDTHGQLYDVFEMMNLIGDSESVLFLGDYVDRGFYSLELFIYLACKKIKRPKDVYLLRGNHESSNLNLYYGLYQNCLEVYGNQNVWKKLNEAFNLLPIAALIDDSTFCCHGGLSPEVPLIETLSLIDRNYEIKGQGPITDLLWSDPSDEVFWRPNPRGSGYCFGRKPTREFMRFNSLSLICRAHEVCEKGFQEWFDGILYTIWSAPNYLGKENSASFLKIQKTKNDIHTFQHADTPPIPESDPGMYFS